MLCHALRFVTPNKFSNGHHYSSFDVYRHVDGRVAKNPAARQRR